MSVRDSQLRPAKSAPGVPTDPPDPAEVGGVLSIDLAAIEANWKKLASMTVPVECAAVVKADAYGCGIDHVTPRLAKAGARTFFVADLVGGRRVRALAA